jgi:hypothetical protein
MPLVSLLPFNAAVALVSTLLEGFLADPLAHRYVGVAMVAEHLAKVHGFAPNAVALFAIIEAAVEQVCPHVLPLDIGSVTCNDACGAMQPDGIVLRMNNRAAGYPFKLCFSSVSDMIMFRLLLTDSV